MSLHLLASVFQSTMTLQEFFLILLWLALIALIIMIIAILVRVFQTVSDLRAVVKENRENINQTMNGVPGITKNIEAVTTEASHVAQVLRPSVNNIADTAESVTHTLKENNPVNEAIVSAYKTINNVKKVVESIGKKDHDRMNLARHEDIYVNEK